jgi:ligand-binding sensor domain-containing protein/signal transduction histidine kinase/CheY-like chemotaxis protein
LLLWGLVVATAVGGRALALDPHRLVSQYSARSWVDRDGLPQNTVLSLEQTHDGYLWLGTWEGLVRFDGVNFTTFDKRNTPELRSPMVRALVEDAAGVLWVGTSAGLVAYREGSFQRVPLGPAGDEALVYALVAAPDGGLWVGAREGLFFLKAGTVRSFGAAEGLPEGEVSALAVDEAGVLWVGMLKGAVLRLEGEKLTPLPLPRGLNRVRELCVSRGGALWVGTDRGLVLLEGGRVQHFTTKDGLPHDAIGALAVDREGNLWVGTDQGTLARRVGTGFSTLGPREGISGDQVMALLEDREGSLWVGTLTGGVVRLRDTPLLPFGVPEGLPSDAPLVVLEDRQGVLWVGTRGGGLVRMKDGQVTRLGVEEGLPQNIVRALAEGREGSLWVGTAGGAYHLEGKRFTRLGREQGLANDLIVSIYADTRGDVWFGTSTGLSRLHEGSITTYGPKEGVPAVRISAITEDREGRLWFGTHAGLLRFNGTGFTRFTPADGLPGEAVLELYADVHGVLWLGTTAGLGLMRGGRFSRVTPAQGLLDENVFRILEDDSGHLWLSSNKGISRVSRQEVEEVADGKRAQVRPLLFDMRDGMRSSECVGAMQPTGWRTRDGHLWFPTVRGLVSVRPSSVDAQRPAATVRLEEVRVNGTQVPHSGRLVLEPGRKNVEFRFTSLALEDSSHLPMRYKLEGLDEDWVVVRDRRSARYPHLAPGSYRFVVEGANRDGEWAPAGVSLEVELKPFLYQTGWFWGLCTLGLVVVATGGYQLRVGRLKRRERWLEARVEERTRELADANRELDENLRALREAQSQLVQAGKMAAVGTLAAGVGHEINNPLAYIVSNLEYASLEVGSLMRELRPEQSAERLKDMDRALREALHGAERVRRIVQDLKTFSRGDEEARGPVNLQAVLESAAKLAGNELRPRARLVKDFGEIPLVEGNESRLAQVFLNLIINSAQALPEGRASENEVRLVTRREGPDRVVAEVCDTGCGISQEVLGRVFEPFFTTKPVGVGTGLGLALCHRFITSMGGEIAVESEPGKGTVVRVTLRAAAAQVPSPVPVQAPAPVAEAPAPRQDAVRGRVLVVDDDLMVSSALRRTLGREHDVEVVVSARAALGRLVGPEGAQLDLILCDLMMPELTGMDLHAEVSAAAPAVARRMVFITGGAFTPAAREFLERVENPRVEKPFDSAKLREQVRAWVLKARSEPGQAA